MGTDWIPEGLLARLVIEKVDGGSGLLYPDCRYNGYLALDASFQSALRNVMTTLRRRPDWIEKTGTAFDFRWRLIPLSAQDGHELPVLLSSIGGRSAEAAFACAVRAALHGERLDPRVGITACFAESGAAHEQLHHVAGIVEKLLALRSEPGGNGDSDELSGTEIKAHRIDQIVVSQDRDANKAVAGTDSATSAVKFPDRVRIHDWTVRFSPAPTFDAAYRLLSDHCRTADVIKTACATRAVELLDALGGLFTDSPLSRDAEVATAEEVEAARKTDLFKLHQRVSVTSEETNAILQGTPWNSRRSFTRLRFLADSGYGKSTMLVEVERRVASAAGETVPLRIGAGPARAGTIDQRPRLLPLLSQVPWQPDGQTNLKRLGKWFFDQVWKSLCGGELTEDAAVTWFAEAVRRGDVLFLLDSTDQTDDELTDLALFLHAQPHCTALLTGRPETREYKAEVYQHDDWDRLWLEPFEEEHVRNFCQDEALTARLWSNATWRPLVTVPILLREMVALARDGVLDQVRNREDVYAQSLVRLVRHGQVRARDKAPFTQQLERATKSLAEAAWLTIHLEAHGHDTAGSNFTGRLTGENYVAFQEQFEQLHQSTRPMEALGLVSVAYIEGEQSGGTALGWRHFSFCEWFAGLRLASMPAEEQESVIRQHALDERWEWIFRFAVCGAARQHKPHIVGHLVRCLLSSGAAFVLWTIIDPQQDGVDLLESHESLDTLCRWLVHRDRGRDSFDTRETSPWVKRTEWNGPRSVVATGADDERPLVGVDVAAILRQLFAIDAEEPWNHRDSRWLHPAWELVVRNLPLVGSPDADATPVHHTCREIHDSFLGEFETRVRAAAERNRGRSRNNWLPADRGLLQLVPDDWLVKLGLLDATTLASIRQWPSATAGSYEQRRDKFNDHLQSVEANYCQCPPDGWEYPYPEDKDADRRLRELLTANRHYDLQRTPVTNLQYEAFDPSHRRFRRMEWRRDDETDDNALDAHPAIEVSWFQARMCCVWLTGRGTFGQFGLPDEELWIACCRAGRDRQGDRFGIPWCDEEGRPVLDAGGNEQFHSLSSYGANFDGRPNGQARRGPNRHGTIPVGQFAANGFGLVDMHGQVLESSQSPCDAQERISEKVFERGCIWRMLFGGCWLNFGRFFVPVFQNSYAPATRNHFIGFRVSRTK